MRVVRRLVQEQVVDNDAVHRSKTRRDVLGVGVGLQDVLTLTVKALEGALDRRIQHVGDTQAWFIVDLDAPDLFKDVTDLRALHMAIARQFVRERAHVARTLHVVLPPQRVNAHAGPTDVAGQHGKVGNADHGGGPLGMLGHAQPVVDRPVAAEGIKPGRLTHLFGRNAGQKLHRLGGVLRLADEFGIVLEFVPIAAIADEVFVEQPLGHDHMRKCCHNGHVCAGGQRQMVLRLDMRAFHNVSAARIDDDQFGSLPQALFQAAGEDRVPIGRVGADDDDNVGFLYGVKVLRAGRSAQRLPQPITGWRMAHPRTGVGVVVQKHRASQFLNQIGLFIGAPTGGDDPHRMSPMFGNDALHALGGEVHRLGPGHFFPRIVDAVADHRRQDAVLVAGIAVGKPPLDAGMPPVGLAVLVRRHPHQLIAAQFGLEAAADPAVGAGGDDRPHRSAQFDHRLFLQGRSRASRHASATRHAFRRQKVVRRHPRRHAAVKATARNGQSESALHLLARPHAARADDALGRIISEIGVAVVLGVPLRVGLAGVVLGLEVGRHFRSGGGLISHVAQANRPGHILQLAIAIRRAGQAIQRVIRDVKLHHPLAQLFQLGILGLHLDARRHRSGAGRRRPIAPLDLDQTQTARPEGIDRVGGAQFRHRYANFRRRPHDRGAFRHRHVKTVDGQRHHGLGPAGRSAEITVGHDEVFHSAASFTAKSSGKWVSADITG